MSSMGGPFSETPDGTVSLSKQDSSSIQHVTPENYRMPLSDKCSLNAQCDSRKRRRKDDDVDGHMLIKHAKRSVREKSSDEFKRDSKHRTHDDRNGYMVVKTGTILNDRYKVRDVLGEGSFGRVVACEDLQEPGRFCAIKISRIHGDQVGAAEAEAGLLEKLSRWDPGDTQRILRLRDKFSIGDHVCLVFDLLGPSIYDFLKGNNYIPYPMRHIKQIAKQLLETVQFLHEHGVVHTDLKPENILFETGDATTRFSRSANREVYVLKEPSIRLIDFGSAVCKGEKHPVTISTRHYRAPEVVLELKWNSAADMWSIGCILLELYTGDCIFMTHSRLEHLAMMERLLGRIPKHMIRDTPREEYFTHDRLDWEKNSRKGKRVKEMVLRLEDYIPRHPTDDELNFFDLLTKLLVFDPNDRADVYSALKHPFISE